MKASSALRSFKVEADETDHGHVILRHTHVHTAVRESDVVFSILPSRSLDVTCRIVRHVFKRSKPTDFLVAKLSLAYILFATNSGRLFYVRLQYPQEQRYIHSPTSVCNDF